jgi:hypothetical protein
VNVGSTPTTGVPIVGLWDKFLGGTMPTLSTVNLVIIKVPLIVTVSGTVTPVVLEPAMGTFITTAQALTVDNTIAVQELHSYDWTTMWERLEFVATSANTSALQTAAATLQTSLTSQNVGVTVTVSAWAVVGATRIVLP